MLTILQGITEQKFKKQCQPCSTKGGRNGGKEEEEVHSQNATGITLL